MDILKEWRMHRPVREVDKFGIEFFSVPCKITSIEELKRPNNYLQKNYRKVDLEMLDFDTGELTYKDGIIYNKTYDRFKHFNSRLPDYTYAKIVAREHSSLKNIIYKTSSYIPGILPILIENYCKLYGHSTDTVSEDGLFEFSYNYSEIRAWARNKLDPPELDEFIFESSNSKNDGWDYYNDQLDLDQQGPEFWDNI